MDPLSLLARYSTWMIDPFNISCCSLLHAIASDSSLLMVSLAPLRALLDPVSGGEPSQ